MLSICHSCKWPHAIWLQTNKPIGTSRRILIASEAVTGILWSGSVQNVLISPAALNSQPVMLLFSSSISFTMFKSGNNVAIPAEW